MTKTQKYTNVCVTVEDRNSSFVPNKLNRSITVRYIAEDNHFILQTPNPTVKSETPPPIFERKDYGMVLNRLKKGYKVSWEVNIQQAKTAGVKKVKSVLNEFVDAMFKEIEEKQL